MTIRTDDFNRTNSSTLGSNWASSNPSYYVPWEVYGNEASPRGFTYGWFVGSHWVADSFGADQYSKCVLGTVHTTSDEGSGPAVRVATSGAGAMYFVQCNTVETRVYLVQGNNAFTQLGSDGPACASGDVIEIKAVGTTITVKRNGTNICGTPVTNSALSSGAPGLWAYERFGTVDNWEGGDVGITPAGVKTGTNANNTTSVTMGADINVVAGQLVVIGGMKFTTSNDPFVATDCTKSSGTATLGEITLDKQIIQEDTPSTSNYMAVGIWSAIVTASGTLRVQVGGATAGSYLLLGIEAFNGTWGSGRVEATNSNYEQTANVTPAHSGDVTTAGPALIVSAMQLNSSQVETITEDAAFTLIYENGTSTDGNGSMIYRIVGTGTTDRGEWAVPDGGFSGWAAAVVAYKEGADTAVSSDLSVSYNIVTDAGVSSVRVDRGRVISRGIGRGMQ